MKKENFGYSELARNIIKFAVKDCDIEFLESEWGTTVATLCFCENDLPKISKEVRKSSLKKVCAYCGKEFYIKKGMCRVTCTSYCASRWQGRHRKLKMVDRICL